jgi:hypothetical protein
MEYSVTGFENLIIQQGGKSSTINQKRGERIGGKGNRGEGWISLSFQTPLLTLLTETSGVIFWN